MNHLSSNFIGSLVFQTGIGQAVEIFKLAASRLMQTAQSLKFPTVQSREMQTHDGVLSSDRLMQKAIRSAHQPTNPAHYESFVVQKSAPANQVQSNPLGQPHGSVLRPAIEGLSLQVDPAYALTTHPHGELILADQVNKGAQPPKRFFLCVTSAYARFMVRLEGDTSECAGFLCCLSANPFQPYHLHLAVIGKASLTKESHHD